MNLLLWTVAVVLAWPMITKRREMSTEQRLVRWSLVILVFVLLRA